MSNEAKKPLTLGRGKLELKMTVETGQVRQSFSHGRSKVVQVERKRKRQFEIGADGKVQEVKAKPTAAAKKPIAEEAADTVQRKLSEEEKAHRLKVLQDAKRGEEAERLEEEERRVKEEARQAGVAEETRSGAAVEQGQGESDAGKSSAEPPEAGAGSNEVGLIVIHFFLSLLLTFTKALPA